MRALLLALLAALLLSALPGTASAAVRSGGIDDPDDVRGALNPPNMPDVQRLAVSYDEGGTVTLSITFYEDTRSRPSEWYQSEYRIILGHRGNDQYTPCQVDAARASFSATVSLTGYASGSVAGFSGSLTGTNVVSPDGRTITAVFTHSALAGRDYHCVRPSSTTWVDSTASNINSHYGTGCDCWYVYSSADTDDLQGFFYFAGFEPVVPAPPSVPPSSTTTPQKKTTPKPLPTLTVAATKRAIKKVLREDFGASYRAGYAKRIGACSRRSRLRIRCARVSWIVGDLSYRGWTSIWYMRDLDDGTLTWDAAYRITRTNEYCESRGRTGCTKTFRFN